MDALGDFYGNQLREFAANGRLDLVLELVESKKVDVNGQHKVNGWTALHWAAKRNHADVVKFLLDRGADPGLLTNGGQRAADLTSNGAAVQLLAVSTERDGTSRPPVSTDVCTPPSTATEAPLDSRVATSAVAFVPNYLRHPAFPYTEDAASRADAAVRAEAIARTAPARAAEAAPLTGQPASRDVVVKVRIADATEKDFIEVDVAPTTSFESLKRKLCEELGVAEQASGVVKMRKLPNTIVRNDRDVARLGDFQELELVFHRQPQPPIAAASAAVGGRDGSRVTGDCNGTTGDCSGSGDSSCVNGAEQVA